MAKVSLQRITRKFGNVTAIEDITFEVQDHEFWVLVGPSGCGKSTILRTIAGLESITSGELYIGERLVNDIPARQRDIAMVFQNYALYPHMSVAENLAFGLRMRQENPANIARKVQEVAHSLNIKHLLKRKPKQLSGGQQQRVALGRAIARKPQVFLLDEPLSNLDAQLREDTRAELKQLHDRFRITTIYVTHDQVEAMTLADRIVMLQDGVIQQIATPQELYAQPINRMVASFFGSPPMNIFPVTYHEGNLVINNQLIPIGAQMQQKLKPQPGEGFDLGIRPEDITIVSPREIGEDLASLIVEIDLVEPLGKETLVRTNFPNSPHTLNLFAPLDWQMGKGDRLTVKFDLQKLFIFDSNTGKTLIG